MTVAASRTAITNAVLFSTFEYVKKRINAMPGGSLDDGKQDWSEILDQLSCAVDDDEEMDWVIW